MGSCSASKGVLDGSPMLEDESTPAKCECIGSLHLPTRSQHFAVTHVACFTPPCFLHKRMTELSEGGDDGKGANRPLYGAKH